MVPSRSSPPVDASPPVATPSSGHRKPLREEQARFFSPPWIETEPAPDSIVSSFDSSPKRSRFPSSHPGAQDLPPTSSMSSATGLPTLPLQLRSSISESKASPI